MEGPYKLPDGWQWNFWGNVGTFTAGSAFKKKFQSHKNYNIPFYKVGSLKYTNKNGYLYDDSNTINDDLNQEIKAKILPVNSIIFAKIGEAIRLNRRGLNKIPCCIDNNLMAFTPSENINYLYIYFWSLGQDFYQLTNATTVPAIRKSDLEKILIPVPPLSTQQKIADLIDREFARLDEAKDKITSALDGAEARKQAILHKAFTGELTAKWREENNLTEPWRNLTLNDVAKWGSGGTPARKNPEYYQNGTINWIKTGELNNGIITDSEEKITEEALKNSSAKLFPKNSVIVAMYGATIGKTGILGIEAATNQACACAVCNEHINYRFLFYFLQNIKKSLIEEGKGGAQPNISQSIIKRRNINVPSLTEQQKIVAILDAYEAKNQALTEKLEATLTQIDTLKKAILSKAFRGELIQ